MRGEERGVADVIGFSHHFSLLAPHGFCLTGKDFAQRLLALGRNAPVQDVFFADARFDDAEILEHRQAIADDLACQAGFVGNADKIAINVIILGQRPQDFDVVIGQGFLGCFRLAGCLGRLFADCRRRIFRLPFLDLPELALHLFHLPEQAIGHILDQPP